LIAGLAERDSTKEMMMRKAYAFGLAAFLAASPAMADVVIGTGGGDAARHEQRAEQDRMAAHHDAAEANRDAAMGNYRGAAREQREAQHEWHAANRQEHKADRDSDDHGGFHVQLGH
jgi:hypothetical protein